jgi:hypothetical protein
MWDGHGRRSLISPAFRKARRSVAHDGEVLLEGPVSAARQADFRAFGQDR